MANVANEAGEISVDQFSDVIPAGMLADDIETLIEALNAKGFWIVD